jgi:HPt (histidine-containing phosphotransfer) domain-containing protein
MFLSNGFNDFLSKPIDMIKLDTALKKWIPKEKQIFSNENVVPNQKNINILAIFYKDGMRMAKEIEKCIETGDYPLYTIHIHGLKSAAANAGFSELSEQAKELEMAGKRGDFAFIKAHNDAFLVALQTRLSSIGETLSANKKEPTDFETLKSELLKLKEAINASDFSSFDEIANALQAFPQAEDILQNALVGEHEKAVAAIDDLLKAAESPRPRWF